MPRYFLKPIFWNTSGYQRPSGVHATSGYPAKYGFGHEEWNDSPKLRFSKDAEMYRAFHTEAVPAASPVEGESVLFMYASHDGVQQLVGVAGKATYLLPEKKEAERLKLVRDLDIRALWKDAWAVDVVQSRYGNSRSTFLKQWNDEIENFTTWICPADHFLWLRTPVTLDAQRITGKQKLLSMFSSYTSVSSALARRLLHWVPVAQRTNSWTRIAAEIDAGLDDAELDVEDVISDSGRSETTRRALVEARRGQGKFRQDLEARWGGACAAGGCRVREVLRASHIKPWRASIDSERLDGANGLLLSANFDSLFDRGLVTFGSDGKMIISDRLSKQDAKELGLPRHLRQQLNAIEKRYLEYHRNFVFL